MRINDVCHAMIEYYHGDARRIQHFIKVHAFAKLIAEQENLTEDEKYTLEIASYVHDIGIKKSEELYGDCSGKHQEELGPELAKNLLINLGCEGVIIKRVCYLVGHHHTYTNMDSKDYQILVESDFLVNLQEDGATIETIGTAYKNIFRTESGRRLCRGMFGL
jgi:HD superfamily phosphodiesterase